MTRVLRNIDVVYEVGWLHVGTLYYLDSNSTRVPVVGWVSGPGSELGHQLKLRGLYL